jgi:hypothetical protein
MAAAPFIYNTIQQEPTQTVQFLLAEAVKNGEIYDISTSR